MCKRNGHDTFLVIRLLNLMLSTYIYAQNQKKEETSTSMMKIYQMPNKRQNLTCIEVSISKRNLQNDIVTPRR